MSFDEFLGWDDGTDTRYELVQGVPVAMAPALEGHGLIAARMARRLEAALEVRRPCRTVMEPGLRHPDRDDSFFVADIGVTCAPIDPGRQYLQDPILIVEILSPSTERHDRRVKLPAYRRIESVQEILFLASDEPYAEIHRRQASGWLTDLIRGPEGAVSLASVGVEIAMAELYEGLAQPEADAQATCT